MPPPVRRAASETTPSSRVLTAPAVVAASPPRAALALDADKLPARCFGSTRPTSRAGTTANDAGLGEDQYERAPWAIDPTRSKALFRRWNPLGLGARPPPADGPGRLGRARRDRASGRAARRPRALSREPCGLDEPRLSRRRAVVRARRFVICGLVPLVLQYPRTCSTRHQRAVLAPSPQSPEGSLVRLTDRLAAKRPAVCSRVSEQEDPHDHRIPTLHYHRTDNGPHPPPCCTLRKQARSLCNTTTVAHSCDTTKGHFVNPQYHFAKPK